MNRRISQDAWPEGRLRTAPGGYSLVWSAIVAGLALIMWTTPARALSCWLSDETGWDFHDPTYAKNEVIYIGGDWNIYDFPCAIGDVYLVPNDGSSWDLRAIGRNVTRKAIQGCMGAAAFYGAILALPNLPIGEYDIVLDEEQDGVYDPGVDLVLGNGPGFALKVVDQTLDLQVDVHAIKTSAAAAAAEWERTGRWTEASFRALSLSQLAVETADLAASAWGPGFGLGYAVVGVAGEIYGFPLSYEDAVMGIGVELISQAATNAASVYRDLAADPPDPDFTPLVTLDPIPYRDEISTAALPNATLLVQNNLLEQAVLGQAFRRAYEKFLGAEAVENYPYTLNQARAARRYCGLMLQTLDDGLAHLDSLEAALVATGRADSAVSAERARELQERIATTGFTGVETTRMSAAGMTAVEVDLARAALLQLELAGLGDATPRDLVAAPRAQMSNAIGFYTSVAAELDQVLAQLEPGWTEEPRSRISGGAIVAAGASLPLDGLASEDPRGQALAYAWDLDMDGDFDDGTEGSVSAVFTRPGDALVGLRVTTTLAVSGVSYKRVCVTAANRMPRIAAAVPESLYIAVLAGSTKHFGVVASDPDADPMTCTWLVDGVEMGGGFTYDYVPADTGIHIAPLFSLPI